MSKTIDPVTAIKQAEAKMARRVEESKATFNEGLAVEEERALVELENLRQDFKQRQESLEAEILKEIEPETEALKTKARATVAKLEATVEKNSAALSKDAVKAAFEKLTL